MDYSQYVYEKKKKKEKRIWILNSQARLKQ